MKSLPIPMMERANGLRTMPDDPLWFRWELLTHNHESSTVALVKQRLRPNMVVLDVGAHVGYYSQIFAQQVGNGGRVVSFEPHPRTFQYLSDNLSDYGNVTPLQLAVSDSAGTAELYDYLMMSASGSLHYDESMAELQRAQMNQNDVAPRMTENFSGETFTVETKKIDDCVKELGIESVDFVKMDIEGAEMRALRGMQETINNSPNLSLIMEYNPYALSSSGDPVEALDEVMAFGFEQMTAIDEDGTLTNWTHNRDALRKATDEMMKHVGVVNVLFTRS